MKIGSYLCFVSCRYSSFLLFVNFDLYYLKCFSFHGAFLIMDMSHLQLDQFWRILLLKRKEKEFGTQFKHIINSTQTKTKKSEIEMKMYNLLDLFKQFSDFITHSLGNTLVLPSSFVAHIWLFHSELQLVLQPFVSCWASLK